MDYTDNHDLNSSVGSSAYNNTTLREMSNLSDGLDDEDNSSNLLEVVVAEILLQDGMLGFTVLPVMPHHTQCGGLVLMSKTRGAPNVNNMRSGDIIIVINQVDLRQLTFEEAVGALTGQTSRIVSFERRSRPFHLSSPFHQRNDDNNENNHEIGKASMTIEEEKMNSALEESRREMMECSEQFKNAVEYIQENVERIERANHDIKDLRLDVLNLHDIINRGGREEKEEVDEEEEEAQTQAQVLKSASPVPPPPPPPPPPPSPPTYDLKYTYKNLQKNYKSATTSADEFLAKLGSSASDIYKINLTPMIHIEASATKATPWGWHAVGKSYISTNRYHSNFHNS